MLQDKANWRQGVMQLQAPIDLYFWDTPNGQKISIALEELDLQYRIVPVDIGKREQFRPEFLAISPNNRIPALVDHDGAEGSPISVFESGAILQYLGRKARKLYPEEERQRVEVGQWLFWQVGGLGPMGGQANHFRRYAPEKIAYGIERYTREVTRLFGVMDRRLSDREFLADTYSIADIACIGWVNEWEDMGQRIDDFSNLNQWYHTVMARSAVQRGLAVGSGKFRTNLAEDQAAKAVMFGLRAPTR
jgi:GST-like protein